MIPKFQLTFILHIYSKCTCLLQFLVFSFHTDFFLVYIVTALCKYSIFWRYAYHKSGDKTYVIGLVGPIVVLLLVSASLDLVYIMR